MTPKTAAPANHQSASNGLSQPTELLEKIQTLEQQVITAEEQQRRAQADYQNLLRRQQEQASRLTKLAARDVVEALLQPLYHLELAAAQLQDQGLNMVVTQFWQQLEGQGLMKVGKIGTTFDPQIMEAIEQQGAGQTVIKVVQPGYTLNGELLQPAKVVVGAPTN